MIDTSVKKVQQKKDLQPADNWLFSNDPASFSTNFPKLMPPVKMLSNEIKELAEEFGQ